MSFTQMRVLFLCLTFASIAIKYTIGSKYLDEPCDRLRRPIHSLTKEERLLYVEGFQTLSRNGILNSITTTHNFQPHHRVHRGSDYFAWHAYLIWELETQIRKLGDKFKCFAMPYWNPTIDYISIFSLDMGNEGGNASNNYCVDDELWSVKNHNKNSKYSYWISESDLCYDDELFPFCCLKRQVSDTMILPTAADIAVIFIDSPDYYNFAVDTSRVHGYIHNFMSSSNPYVTLQGGYATDDPIFWLLHSYFEYLRFLWASCWNYDMIGINDMSKNITQSEIYWPYCLISNPLLKNSDIVGGNCGAVGWNDIMDYFPMDQEDWNLASQMDIKVKTMFNPTDWGISYELGEFYRNTHLNKWCNHINNEWFVYNKQSADSQNSDLQNYINEQWSELSENYNININEKFKIVQSMTCKYNRETSKQSCWDESMNNLEIETCSDRNINDASEINLDDMLNFGGVKDNKCLQKIRKNMFYSFFDDDIALKACNGEFDYKCPQYSLDESLGEINEANNNKLLHSQQINQSISYYILLLVIILIFGVLLFCFHCGNDKKLSLIKNNDTDFTYSTF